MSPGRGGPDLAGEVVEGVPPGGDRHLLEGALADRRGGELDTRRYDHERRRCKRRGAGGASSGKLGFEV